MSKPRIDQVSQLAKSYAPPKPSDPTGACLINPDNATGSGTNAYVSGTLDLMPYDIDFPGLDISGISYQIGAAQSGGTMNVLCGLYRDSGRGPLLDGGPIYSVSSGALLQTAGRKTLALGVTLTPGRWWLGTLPLNVTTVTTQATFTTWTAIGRPLPYPVALNPGTISKSYRIAGLSALPTAAAAFSANGGNNAIAACLVSA